MFKKRELTAEEMRENGKRLDEEYKKQKKNEIEKYKTQVLPKKLSDDFRRMESTSSDNIRTGLSYSYNGDWRYHSNECKVMQEYYKTKLEPLGYTVSDLGNQCFFDISWKK